MDDKFEGFDHLAEGGGEIVSLANIQGVRFVGINSPFGVLLGLGSLRSDVRHDDIDGGQ